MEMTDKTQETTIEVLAALHQELAEAKSELTECRRAHAQLYENDRLGQKEVNEWWRPKVAELEVELERLRAGIREALAVPDSQRHFARPILRRLLEKP